MNLERARGRNLRAIGSALILIGFITVFGCNGSKSTTSPPPPPPRSIHFHSVNIQNFAFNSAAVTAAVGDTVMWTNNDSTTHTVTSDSGSELGATLNPGGTYQHIFLGSGSFPYHCSIHPEMHGTVTVQ